MVCNHVIHIQTEKHFCYKEIVCLTIIMLREIRQKRLSHGDLLVGNNLVSSCGDVK